MDWIFFALLAPLFWTINNYVDKYTLGKITKNIHDFMFFSSLTGWIFAPLFMILFGVPLLSVNSLVPILLGVALVYSYGLYGKALESNETSRVVILFNLTPVFILVLGFLFLGQTLVQKDFLAFVLILIGAVVISYQKPAEQSLFTFSKSLIWIIAAVVVWSVMFLFADWMLEKMSFVTFITFEIIGVALSSLVMLAIPLQRKQIISALKISTPKKYIWFLFNNSIDLFGQMSMRKALAVAPVAGLVTVVTQIQSLYAIVVGLVVSVVFPNIFPEDKSLQGLATKILGAALMFAGMYVLFLM
jgi:drug/metabolite transporter (DMT)-like permease